MVPPEHPESNFAAARKSLIGRVEIPQGNVHEVPTGGGDAEQAAASYEGELRRFFRGGETKTLPSPREARDENLFPAFDLVLLGLGPDGHTASLFPESRALEERERWAVAVKAPVRASPRVDRVTLTLPVLNRAGCVLFLCSRTGKEEALRRVLEEKPERGRGLPAQRVLPGGDLLWFIAP
jgi:6-phosphogluconolactonase